MVMDLFESLEFSWERQRIRQADPNIKSLEEDISQVLGTPVEIEPAIAQAGRKKGVPGKLIITFYDNDQLEGVLDGIRRGSRSR